MSVRWTLLDESLRGLLAAGGLRSYGDFIDCRLGAVVGETGTTRTRRLRIDHDGRGETLFLKRYQYIGGRWRHRFRPHKGWVEARNYRILRRCGVPVPDVIAFGGRRSGLRLLDAFLLTRAVEPCCHMEALALRAPRPTAREIDALSKVVAEVVARMHAKHFYHFDLQWRNLLVRAFVDDTADAACGLERDGGMRGRVDKGGTEREDVETNENEVRDGIEVRKWTRVGTAGAAPEVFVIDSSRGGLRHTPPGRTHGRIRDLASLDKLGRVHLTRTQRLRWLRRYLGLRRLGQPGRRMVRAVAAYVARKA